jgi:hypothetical protein
MFILETALFFLCAALLLLLIVWTSDNHQP